MRGSVRRLLVVGLAWGVVGLAGSPAGALGEGTSPGEGAGGSSSSLEGALVVSGSPTEGQQAQAAEEARRSSPEAVAARGESRTKYEHLGSGQAAKVTGEAFSELIDEPAGGPPKLPVGQRIMGYPTDDAAQVDLPDGKHG